ncbi:hypothetical protein PspTeo4_38168 [Pseudomonas sp. Teo4]|nr:hypothetical protein [Pseudomonas sp. Teo4]
MNKTLGFKLGMIALLMMLLLIPLMLIDGLIDERQNLRDGVLRDIAQSASFDQQISGPLLVVPYRKYQRRWIEKDGQSVQETSTVTGQLYFLPETFDTDLAVDTELRAGVSTRRACSTPRGASAGASNSLNVGVSTRISTITVSTSRSWLSGSVISVASKTVWS